MHVLLFDIPETTTCAYHLSCACRSFLMACGFTRCPLIVSLTRSCSRREYATQHSESSSSPAFLSGALGSTGTVNSINNLRSGNARHDTHSLILTVPLSFPCKRWWSGQPYFAVSHCLRALGKAISSSFIWNPIHVVASGTRQTPSSELPSTGTMLKEWLLLVNTSFRYFDISFSFLEVLISCWNRWRYAVL